MCLTAPQAVLLVMVGIQALFDNADKAMTMNQAFNIF